LYANNWDQHYVPAAADIMSTNRVRWHGVRNSLSSPFDPKYSALYTYLDGQSQIKICPSFEPMVDSGPRAFEAGTGGYGYNQQYVGGTNYLHGNTSMAATISTRIVESPSKCIMFADAAMPMGAGGQTIAEYSFIEPPFWHLSPGKEPSTAKPDPSIHFRHRGHANTVWCDGHAGSEKFTFTTDSNIYRGDNNKWKVGWFGPDNNSNFDIW